MRETMEWILCTWSLYWGEGFYQYLLLVAAVYLLFCKRKEERTKCLLSYLAMVLFVFFFPVTASIIRECIGQDVYWRVLWILPLVPLLAYAGTEFVKGQKRFVVRTALVLMLAAAAAFCGKSLWQAGNYEKVHNYQQVPDEVAQICDLVNSNREGDRAHLATDDYIASYVRIYDASITMPYGRAGRGARSAKSRRLYNQISAPAPNYKAIARLARSRRCNFIVVKLSKETTQAVFEKKGYMLTGMVNEYGVFKLEK